MTELLITHRGGCHCGRVQFEVQAPARLSATECNCSMCRKVGYWHLMVPRSQLKVLQGKEVLTTYTFNTGVAQHYFCSVCGVKSFYVPRSHPDGYSVNVRCIESDTIQQLDIRQFDGANWEDHIGELAPLPES
ncbi:GFA family protein [Synechococcales cyanobacterium C]|uniref:GFA family protein n=2 Tax=Petrachloros TaxID=2918834 RepID=A0A8K2ANG2_9CYAN|nr:GFA family protein [Petrachloros mirabilis ULC683]